MCPEIAKKPGWTDESEPEGGWEECEGRKGIGHILQDFVGLLLSENFAFFALSEVKAMESSEQSGT